MHWKRSWSFVIDANLKVTYSRFVGQLIKELEVQVPL